MNEVELTVLEPESALFMLLLARLDELLLKVPFRLKIGVRYLFSLSSLDKK